MEDMVLCRLGKGGPQLRFLALRSWRRRMKGLLGTDCDADPVALCPCTSVHTLGMRYPIDVALVAQDGLVLTSRRRLVPGRVLSVVGARYALERPSCDGPWLKTGTWVRIQETRAKPRPTDAPVAFGRLGRGGEGM